MAATDRLPEKCRTHSMATVYDYEDVDTETGLQDPCILGNFVVRRPHATFRSPAWFNQNVDPFPQLERVTMEEGDILLCTSPKTGTHFCFEILRMLTSGKAEHTDILYQSRWIDIAPYDYILKTNQTMPRVLTSHLPLSCLPPNFRRPDTNVIVPIRNLKGTFVSFYHHMNGMRGKSEKRPWGDYFKYQLHAKSVMYWGPFDWYADLWDIHKHNPNVLIVSYEELIIDPEPVIHRMADHIGVVCTQEFISDVANASRFNNVKQSVQATEKYVKAKYGDDFTLYRKGKIGDWKNLFTVSQNEEFHAVFDVWNKDRQIPMIYSHPSRHRMQGPCILADSKP